MSESRQAQSPYPRGLDERAKGAEVMVDRNLDEVTGEMCPAAQKDLLSSIERIYEEASSICVGAHLRRGLVQ
jgi:hypothetical protein